MIHPLIQTIVPAADAERLTRRAWGYLLDAREARRDASEADTQYEARVHLTLCREYIRLARRTNHQSLRARQAPQKWTPPVLREIEGRRVA